MSSTLFPALILAAIMALAAAQTQGVTSITNMIPGMNGQSGSNSLTGAGSNSGQSGTGIPGSPLTAAFPGAAAMNPQVQDEFVKMLLDPCTWKTMEHMARIASASQAGNNNNLGG